MILMITKDIAEHEIDGDVYRVSIEYLAHKGTHLYIASQQWDELICELTEDIPLETLKYVRRKVNKLNVTFDDSHSKHIMLLLTELYPEKSGAIRKQFMLGRDLHEVLS